MPNLEWTLNDYSRILFYGKGWYILLKVTFKSNIFVSYIIFSRNDQKRVMFSVVGLSRESFDGRPMYVLVSTQSVMETACIIITCTCVCCDRIFGITEFWQYRDDCDLCTGGEIS